MVTFMSIDVGGGGSFFPKRTDKLDIYQDVQSMLDNKPIKSYTYPKGHNLDECVPSFLRRPGLSLTSGEQ
jgi:hypothetical protein